MTTERVPAIPEPSTGVKSVWIPMEFTWDANWRLTQGVMVHLETSAESVTAVAGLEGIDEYGEGATQDAALYDLLTSLTEYMESLEEREGRLHPTAEQELEALRRLIQRSSAD